MSESKTEEKLFNYHELAVAVDLPTSLTNELQGAIDALSRVANPLHMQIFWIPARLSHLAVLYTVQVREDLISLVVDALRAPVGDRSSFRLPTAGLILAPEPVAEGESLPPQAIWLKIGATEELVSLRQALKEALQGVDVDADGLEFAPHVPLALIDSFRDTREFTSVFADWKDRDYGELPVQALLLKKTLPVEGNTEHPFEVIANLTLRS